MMGGAGSMMGGGPRGTPLMPQGGMGQGPLPPGAFGMGPGGYVAARGVGGMSGGMPSQQQQQQGGYCGGGMPGGVGGYPGGGPQGPRGGTMGPAAVGQQQGGGDMFGGQGRAPGSGWHQAEAAAAALAQVRLGWLRGCNHELALHAGCVVALLHGTCTGALPVFAYWPAADP
jgi:hypothetical protein